MTLGFVEILAYVTRPKPKGFHLRGGFLQISPGNYGDKPIPGRALASARPEIGIFWERAGGSQSGELRRRRRTVDFSRRLARKGGMGGGEALGRRSSDRDVVGESTPELPRGDAEGFASPLFAGFGRPGTSALAGRSAVGRAYAGCVRGCPRPDIAQSRSRCGRGSVSCRCRIAGRQ